ncbi:carboxypeptidase regulatory-like domain-containing protein [Actinoplanes sp. NPDC051513]|uniref:carboxypeptidase-like regulatory domain-containing protein n=1 Tax=Actinoplanes sp. NPDC051513 TaxID=3363908 RepID=UPI003789B46C
MATDARIVVTGQVDAGVGSARACLARGHVAVATADADESGRFELSASGPAGPLLLLVLADGRDAVRRRLEAGQPESAVDVGRLELVPVEWPAGVHGTLWDEDAQAPVPGGMVTLSTSDRAVAGPVRADPDGTFTIRMSCERPLPPGDYRLEAVAPGWSPAVRSVRIALEPSVTSTGRIHLDPLPRNG